MSGPSESASKGVEGYTSLQVFFHDDKRKDENELKHKDTLGYKSNNLQVFGFVLQV